MADLHNALRRSKGLLRAFKNALGMQDATAGVERLGETLTPVIDLWRRPEWELLRGDELFAIAQAVAAGGAGTFARIGIFNPAGSNLIVVVTHHQLSGFVAGDVMGLFPTAILLGNSATVKMRDRRRTVSHGALVHFEASATALADQMYESQPLVSSPPLEIPIVLAPGTGFLWRTGNDASALNASFLGYQRVANAGELV